MQCTADIAQRRARCAEISGTDDRSLSIPAGTKNRSSGRCQMDRSGATDPQQSLRRIGRAVALQRKKSFKFGPRLHTFGQLRPFVCQEADLGNDWSEAGANVARRRACSAKKTLSWPSKIVDAGRCVKLLDRSLLTSLHRSGAIDPQPPFESAECGHSHNPPKANDSRARIRRREPSRRVSGAPIS